MRPNGRDGLADRVGQVGAGVGIRNGRRGESWRTVGGVARWSRRAVQRALEQLAQLRSLIVAESSQQLEALRGRGLASNLDEFFRFSKGAICEPSNGLLSLIDGRTLTPRTTRDQNLLAARDGELQLDQFAAAARGATHFEGQVDEREILAEGVA